MGIGWREKYEPEHYSILVYVGDDSGEVIYFNCGKEDHLARYYQTDPKSSTASGGGQRRAYANGNNAGASPQSGIKEDNVLLLSCFLQQEQAWSPRISRSFKISVIPSLLRLQMVNLVEMVILVKWSTWPNGQLGQMVNLVK